MQENPNSNKIQYKSLAFMGYENYRVGTDGSFWRWFKTTGWRLVKSSPVRSGYLIVGFCKDGVQKLFLAHRVVLMAFVGLCPDGMEACHNDGDRHNNKLTNLRWDTRLNNHADRQQHGTTPTGEKNYGAKLTEDIVREIRRKWATGNYDRKYFQIKHKLSKAQVCKILNETSWKHLV